MPVNGKRRTFLKRATAAGLTFTVAGCVGDDSNDDAGNGNGTDDGESEVTRPRPDEPDEFEPVQEIEWLATSRDEFPSRYVSAETIINQLEELGFDITFNVLPLDPWAEAFLGLDWDILIHHEFGNIERLLPINMFHFHAQPYNEEPSLSRWEETEEEFRPIFEDFVSTLNPEDGQPFGHDLQEIYAKNLPGIPILHPKALVAAETQNYDNWNTMVGTWAFWNNNTLRDIDPTTDIDTLVYGSTQSLQVYPNVMGMQSPETLFLHRFVYDTLTELDYEGEPYGRAAEEWEIIDDTTIHVRLRDDLEFHDGTPLTSEDVKFTYDFIKEYPIPYIVEEHEGYYESTEILSEFEFEFHLETPFIGWIQNTMFMTPILPKHIWEGVPEDEGIPHPDQWESPDMTGSGPFEFVNYSPGDSVVLEKNQNHFWADDYAFDTNIYEIYGTLTALIGDMRQGEVQIGQFLGSTEFEQAENEENIIAVENENHEIAQVWLNASLEPFNDVLVRRAMAHAINRDDIIDIVYDGRATPATSPIGPSNEFWHNPDVPDYPYDLEEAIDLLVESGFRWDDDGRLLKPLDWEPSLPYAPFDD